MLKIAPVSKTKVRTVALAEYLNTVVKKLYLLGVVSDAGIVSSACAVGGIEYLIVTLKGIEYLMPGLVHLLKTDNVGLEVFKQLTECNTSLSGSGLLKSIVKKNVERNDSDIRALCQLAGVYKKLTHSLISLFIKFFIMIS